MDKDITMRYVYTNAQMINGVGRIMTSMFEKYAVGREAEQGNIKKAVVADTAAEEKRTTLSLSLTVSDKKTLKMMALQRETTIAAIIHEWIQEHLEEA